MPMIRVSEAARFLAVSDDTIRRWTENGTLTPRKRAASETRIVGILSF